MQACKENRIESIALLIDAGADVGLFNRAGERVVTLSTDHISSHLISLIVQASHASISQHKETTWNPFS